MPKHREVTVIHDDTFSENLTLKEKMQQREDTIRQLRNGGFKGEASNSTKTRDELERALDAEQGQTKILRLKNNELSEQLRVLKNKVNNQRIIINRYEDADHPSESRKLVELRMGLRQKQRILDALERQLKEAGQDPDYLPPRSSMNIGFGENKRGKKFSVHGGGGMLLLG